MHHHICTTPNKTHTSAKTKISEPSLLIPREIKTPSSARLQLQPIHPQPSKMPNNRSKENFLATVFVAVETNPKHQQHDQENQNANQTSATIFLYTKMESTSYYQPQYQFNKARQQDANPTQSGNKGAAG
ncbi:hypothetical protein Nepgr_026639 [Nepenthes gracilis]|uniref:Uncharacterized protein n=1 Tax=Nepenthes gracilis TaxID=150966 RepID=A0AAD3Y2P8_NEPGR|nr:hypothetical protein Nepgr_026639 [Nepenthes gracilis]